MAEKSTLTLQQKQRQYLSQQQIQLAKILELTAPELDDAVQRELEENPALEAADEETPQLTTDDGSEFHETEEEMRRNDYSDPDDIPYYFQHTQNNSRDDRTEFPVTPDTSESMYDYLLAQLGEKHLSPDVEEAARYIIGNLDSNGYLRRTPEGVADDMAFHLGREIPVSRVVEALKVIQNLEPYGIGGSGLQECLLIQLKHLPDTQAQRDAIRIIEEEFRAFTMKHTHIIVSHLGLSNERVTKAIDLILTLNPKPGAILGNGPGSKAAPIIPDFIIDINDGRISVTLNNRIPELRISESFDNAVRRMKENARLRKEKGNDFLKMRYNDARDFIALVNQRQNTLFAVMTAIVRAQREYFLTEDVHKLKPLGIKDIAAETGYDLSVISRATAGKYAATPWGVLPLRFFMSTSLGNDGEEFTAKGVQDVLKQLVDKEDKRHPLSDERLRELIAARGYDISRRTVAKYRDRLQIPVARLRKSMGS